MESRAADRRSRRTPPAGTALGGGARADRSAPVDPHLCGDIALFVDPWLLPSYPEPIRLDAGEVRRLLAALGTIDSDGPHTGVDLTAGYTELRTLAGCPLPLDPRVPHAVDLSTLRDPDMPITSIAIEVGLSAPRLRALVRQDVGITLTRLRRWGRLRTAIADLPDTTAALGPVVKVLVTATR